MVKKWSNNWKSSTKPAKQRKYVKNAPLHIKSRMLVSTLAKDLRQKYGKRSARVIKGDKVKVMTGQFKKKEGKVDHVNVKMLEVFVSGIEKIRMDGTKSLYPINPSNLMITTLNLDDKKRVEALGRKGDAQSKKENNAKAK